MTMYLTIITTVLVLTQIIRVTQNAVQLKNFKQTDMKNIDLINDWKEVIEKLHDVLKSLEEKK